ncbi:hypothetical protein [Flavivirga spongiicola]|uniref:Zinc-binding metallopeptidase n=1 Tax=Flavivirga spongiicola TaxID=421621 RepID=A0ABU7XXL8_9FLAO|nr:hypothetical protein [Flavivirga sp. MEBiC05379]MDO5980546.1 hypothetical protein [Flavivirga sp. MEBiC05379]
MKYLNIKLVALLFSLLIAFTSCNKDDSIFDEKVEKKAEEKTEENNNQNGEDGEIISFTINGEDLVKLKTYNVTGKNLELQKDTKKHQEIWALVKKIIPLSHRNRISEFILYSGETSGSAGFVFESSKDLSTWKMGIAIDFAYDGGFNKNGELAYTIIHEFGHILTLDKNQVNSSINESDCSNFYTGEGCAKEASFINQSYNKFWKDIWGEFNSAGEDETKRDAFYTKHKNRFLTQYASTNPGEDSAEVFAVFVTRNGGANGNTIAEQKLKLMYTYSNFVELRNYIRGNISNTSKNSIKAKSSHNFLPEAGSWKQANTIGKPGKLHCASSH